MKKEIFDYIQQDLELENKMTTFTIAFKRDYNAVIQQYNKIIYINSKVVK